jgi:hypothetical protein
MCSSSAPGIAWQATDQLALGAALNIYYASLNQRVFPNTSVLDADPQNSSDEIKNASAVYGCESRRALWAAPALSLI